MYIAKFSLDMKIPEVRRAVSDRQVLHAAVQKMFSADRASYDVLYRLAGKSLYVSASSAPQHDACPPGFNVCFENELPLESEGSVHRFSLVVIPRKCVNAKKVILRTEDERFSWLNRKAAESGFAICSVRETGREPINSRKKGFDLDAFKYEGTLVVTDAALFNAALLKGIGTMKAYGCGMLMIA